MKIKKFNENNSADSESHILTFKDHMGSTFSYIFETLDDVKSYFLSYIYDIAKEEVEEVEEVDSIMIEFINENNIYNMTYKYNRLCSELGIEEKVIYSNGETMKPKLTSEEFIEKWKLNKDAKKYNL